jgi:hypothetical protein
MADDDWMVRLGNARANGTQNEKDRLSTSVEAASASVERGRQFLHRLQAVQNVFGTGDVKDTANGVSTHRGATREEHETHLTREMASTTVEMEGTMGLRLSAPKDSTKHDTDSGVGHSTMYDPLLSPIHSSSVYLEGRRSNIGHRPAHDRGLSLKLDEHLGREQALIHAMVERTGGYYCDHPNVTCILY